MILSKKDLVFYITADSIKNGYPAFCNLKTILMENFAILGGKVLVIKFLFHLRRYAYYYNTHKKCSVGI